MKIAIASSGPDLSGQVPGRFQQSPWLLIVETETGALLEALPRGAGGDPALARAIVDQECEGLLCGPLEREPFLIIADEGQVTRYLAAGLSGAQALSRFLSRDLELIRDHIGAEPEHRHRRGNGGCQEGF